MNTTDNPVLSSLREEWLTDLFWFTDRNPVFLKLEGMVEDMYALSSSRLPSEAFVNNLSSFIFYKYSLDSVPSVDVFDVCNIRYVKSGSDFSGTQKKHRYTVGFQYGTLGTPEYFKHFADKMEHSDGKSTDKSLYISEKCGIVFLVFLAAKDSQKTRNEIKSTISYFLEWHAALSKYIKEWNLSLRNAVEACFEAIDEEESNV